MKINFTIGVLSLGLLVTLQALAAATPEATLDSFYKAGADANQAELIATLAADAVFLGVDSDARLQGQLLRDAISARFASPNAWAYRSSARTIRVSVDGSVAWFDESLEHDQLGRGRASGVLVLNGDSWKIAQYDLTVPLAGAATVPVAAATATVETEKETETPRKPECRKLRFKTNKKGGC